MPDTEPVKVTDPPSVIVGGDGSVVIEVGVAENGQGLKTAMVAILCEALGIGDERVEFLDTDTSTVPDGGPTVASRGTLVGGRLWHGRHLRAYCT